MTSTCSSSGVLHRGVTQGFKRKARWLPIGVFTRLNIIAKSCLKVYYKAYPRIRSLNAVSSESDSVSQNVRALSNFLSLLWKKWLPHTIRHCVLIQQHLVKVGKESSVKNISLQDLAALSPDHPHILPSFTLNPLDFTGWTGSCDHTHCKGWWESK